MRLTLKHLMVGVALIGLNLFVVVHCLRHHHHGPYGPLRVTVGSGRGVRWDRPDGSLVFVVGHLEGTWPGDRPQILLRPPEPPLSRAWSGAKKSWSGAKQCGAIHATGASTLLVLLAWRGRRRWRRRTVPPDGKQRWS